MTRPRRYRLSRFSPLAARVAVLSLGAASVLALALPPSARAEETPSHRLTGHLELGFLAVASHRIQFSNDGTYFSYPSQGGQDNLFAVSRMSLDLSLSPRHTLVFLYQPLRLETRALLENDLRVDGLVFPSGTPMRFLYGFPFYRVSYLYNLSASSDNELAVGLSLQIRNATIEFESLDGALFRSNRDIGPVPILKVRARRSFEGSFWVGAEADGFYAPISYINGSDNEVVGAILDASLRAGLVLPRNTEVFLNVRYLGGGAVGTSDDDEGPGDGYVKNWLHFLTVTAGLTLHLF
jgi:hypothetical protein